MKLIITLSPYEVYDYMSLMIFDSIRELIFDKINTKIWWKGNILLIDLGFQNLSSNTSFPHFIDFSSIFEHFTLDWIPHLTLDLISLKERFILFFAFFWIICVHCFALFFFLIKFLTILLLGPICVETPEGKKAYIIEQENLSIAASTVRFKLIDAYDTALAKLR